jgi:hypothetical protein
MQETGAMGGEMTQVDDFCAKLVDDVLEDFKPRQFVVKSVFYDTSIESVGVVFKSWSDAEGYAKELLKHPLSPRELRRMARVRIYKALEPETMQVDGVGLTMTSRSMELVWEGRP